MEGGTALELNHHQFGHDARLRPPAAHASPDVREISPRFGVVLPAKESGRSSGSGNSTTGLHNLQCDAHISERRTIARY